jgi:hypothetical protein
VLSEVAGEADGLRSWLELLVFGSLAISLTVD